MIKNLNDRMLDRYDTIYEELDNINKIKNKKKNFLKNERIISDVYNNFNTVELMKKIKEEKERYISTTLELITNYYIQCDIYGEACIEDAFFEKFKKCIDENNIEINILSISIHIKNYYNFLNNFIQLKNNTLKLEKIINNPIHAVISENITDSVCLTCGVKMDINSETAEYVCSCGLYRESNSSPDDYRKSSSYEPLRHFNFWMDGIQAKRKIKITKEHEDMITECLKRDKVSKSEINCFMIRMYLKEKKLTKYNNAIPQLVYKFSNKLPPEIDHNDMKDITAKFVKAMNILKNISKEDENRPYYPFCIYKILEDKFSDRPAQLSILDYIHMQSKNTTSKNDKKWQKLCKYGNGELGIKFRVTNYIEIMKKYH